MNYFVFILDEKYYGLPFSAIEKVIRAVALIPVPKSPENLLGLLNLKGSIIPVINIRQRLNLPEREMELSDRIVILSISGRSFAFVADGVEGVVDDSSFKLDSKEDMPQILPEMAEYIEGVGRLNGHTVIIYKQLIIDN